MANKLQRIMDNKFTELIKQWLETPSNQRDYSVGALYLLKLSGNRIMYRNVVAQIEDLITNHSVPLNELFAQRITAD
ncbi:MAG: hypothetical protein MSS95_08385 [Bacteroidales bacterium]|nr:hypothetical protein [Bacteroidales bacterium]